ncbi:MAG: hypothetical protein R3183_13125 [Oleiphilaceae bacterium]|nr:hypothetical protein [Oleiphilaceae bacterium]
MSLLDSMKDKLDAQVESWEKELESEKAKLKEHYAKAKNEQASEDLKDEASQTIERNIEALREKIARAKAQIEDLVDA